MTTPTWAPWTAHFQSNEARPPIAVSADPCATPALLRTLAILQRAETGEGRIAKAIDGADLPNIDDDYRAALKLFLREEARHAGLLAEILRAHGAKVFLKTWRDGLFARVRRFAGVRFKLFVFLTAEVSAILIFGSLVEHLPEGPIKRSLARMLGDEENHLAFHAQFFRTALSSRVARWLFRAAFIPGACAGALVMALDNRAALAELGVTPRFIAGRFLELLNRALNLAAPPARTMVLSAS
jgi:hypothetical protein